MEILLSDSEDDSRVIDLCLIISVLAMLMVELKLLVEFLLLHIVYHSLAHLVVH